MVEHDWLSERFAEHQDRLRAVAQRMLGSPGEAEDAVQEAWLRVSRADTGRVENPAGWLTTVVARVCLNMLEARRTRYEEPAGALPPEPAVPRTGIHPGGRAGPEEEALLADSVGVALMVVLDTLTPAERLAFVLHDVFAVSFGEIGAVIDRSPAAARQLASRARRRLQGAAGASDAARSAKRDVVAAFLAAARSGDFAALLELLDPDAVVGEIRGADAVAAFFTGRAQAARLALVDGVPAAVWSHRGRAKAVLTFGVSGGRITRIAIDTDPDRLRDLDIVLLPPQRQGAVTSRTPRPARGATGTDLRLSSYALAVHDLDEALGFYVDVLGFEIRADGRAEGARRVGVGPPSQPEVHILLEAPGAAPGVPPADRRAVEELMSKGLLGRVVLGTDDCDAAFERIEAAGAEVMQEPISRPDGVRDCAFLDPSRNMVRFVQR
ncbi:hypothetical protein GCM10027168_45150 [Streptomyces capparidis]